MSQLASQITTRVTKYISRGGAVLEHTTRVSTEWKGKIVIKIVGARFNVSKSNNNTLKLILEQKEVVCGRDGDDVLGRVPGRVQNLLVEVQAVHVDLIFFPLPTRTHLQGSIHQKPNLFAIPYFAIGFVNISKFFFSLEVYLSWFEHGLGFGDVARRLERHVALGRPVEHAEEVVVWASHNGRVVAVPAALELVKDAVILVQRAQLRPEVLVHLIISNKQPSLISILQIVHKFLKISTAILLSTFL